MYLNIYKQPPVILAVAASNIGKQTNCAYQIVITYQTATMFKVIQWNINYAKKTQPKPRIYNNMMFEFEVENHPAYRTKDNSKKNGFIIHIKLINPESKIEEALKEEPYCSIIVNKPKSYYLLFVYTPL